MPVNFVPGGIIGIEFTALIEKGLGKSFYFKADIVDDNRCVNARWESFEVGKEMFIKITVGRI